MFIDEAKIWVKGGDGGRGAVSLRREKFVPYGGPDGGDGGNGGDVIIEADKFKKTLIDFHYKRHYEAGKGEAGKGKNRHGKNGEDIVIKVPLGTAVYDEESGALICDLVENGQRAVLARGGKGGRGNARFATSTYQTPRFAEKGEPGEGRWVRLELKLLADVGIIGYPNVGKSTFISKVSAARPKIAPYPFTTLNPVLGVVKLPDARSFVLADMPGLIEGAHKGAGLGHKFLRHIERTKLLVHMLDMACLEHSDPVESFQAVNRELKLYNERLANLEQIIAANKMDLQPAQENLEKCLPVFQSLGYEIFPISALTGQGVDKLLYAIADKLAEIEKQPFVDREPSILLKPVIFSPKSEEIITATKIAEGQFQIQGKRIERLVSMTDFENEEAVAHFKKVLKRMGIDKLLRQKGAKPGDLVTVKDIEFEYEED